MKLKALIFVSAALAAALALAGCGSAGSSSTASSAGSSTASSVASSSEVSSSAASSEAASSSAVEQVSSLDLDGAFDELLKANPISNQFEITAINIEYDFGLAADDVVAYKGVKSNDNGDAGLVLVLEVPAGRVDAVCDALDTYLEDQIVFYGNYAEFADAQAHVASASVGYADGDDAGFVMLVIQSNEADGGDALASAKENAIDIAMG